MVQTVTLTREQQMLARSFGVWQMTQILVHPEVKSPAGWPWVGGGSVKDSMPAEPGDWYAYDAKSIRIEDSTGKVRHSVAWGTLRIYSRQLDPGLIERLEGADKACHAHQSEYRLFAAPAEAVGCGPIPADEAEWTDAHRLYVEAHTDWVENMVKPHRAQSEALADELAFLLDEAFPLADGLCRCGLLTLPHIYATACVEYAEKEAG